MLNLRSENGTGKFNKLDSLGQTLPYNIYIPKDYNPAEKYPLVLFIHDAGVASGDVTHTLYQGNGATSWAEPQAQARHKWVIGTGTLVHSFGSMNLSL